MKKYEFYINSMVLSRGPFLERPGDFLGLRKLFCVCHVYLRDQSFNNFENDTMKLSVNKAKLTGS